MTKYILTTLIMVASYSTVAYALPAMGAIDANNDGNVTWEEFSGRFKGISKEHFNEIDTDKNGHLDKNEMAEFRNRMGGTRPNSNARMENPTEAKPQATTNGLPALRPKQ